MGSDRAIRPTPRVARSFARWSDMLRLHGAPLNQLLALLTCALALALLHAVGFHYYSSGMPSAAKFAAYFRSMYGGGRWFVAAALAAIILPGTTLLLAGDRLRAFRREALLAPGGERFLFYRAWLSLIAKLALALAMAGLALAWTNRGLAWLVVAAGTINAWVCSSIGLAATCRLAAREATSRHWAAAGALAGATLFLPMHIGFFEGTPEIFAVLTVYIYIPAAFFAIREGRRQRDA